MTKAVPTFRTTQAVVLREPLSGLPQAENLALVDMPVAERGPDDVLIGVADLSLDPYVRTALAAGHMGEPAVPMGSVVPGTSVGIVLESDQEAVPPGTWVLASTGWRELAVVPVSSATPVSLPDGVPRSSALGALGMPGLTAYAALERHLQPRGGETVVLSSATGGVGAVAGQLARTMGARPVAIVGSAAKAEDAMRLGYAAAVVRTEPDWEEALAHACPGGVDCYLHMGDMPTLHGVLKQLAHGARVSLCGLMDQYNDGPRTMLSAGAVMSARAIVYGMVVYDHLDLATAHRARVTELLRTSELMLHEERHEGLEQAPAAFARLMAGHNRGKVIVAVSHAWDSHSI